MPRRRELIRLLRDGFLEWTADDRIAPGLFLRLYRKAPALAQLDLVNLQWALSHPITVIAIETLVTPALSRRDRSIPLDDVEAVVAAHVDTGSAESLRKTRTVLLGAMEDIGTLTTSGTGQHRYLEAARGTPHPMGFAYLVLRELAERGVDAMMISEVTESSLATRATQCGKHHAESCLKWCIQHGWLVTDGDEIRGK